MTDQSMPALPPARSIQHGINFYIEEDLHAYAQPLLERIKELEALNDAYVHALAQCRDVFAIPGPGEHAEIEWLAAMADPLGVPAFVRTCAAISTKDKP